MEHRGYILSWDLQDVVVFLWQDWWKCVFQNAVKHMYKIGCKLHLRGHYKGYQSKATTPEPHGLRIKMNG